MKTSFSDDTRRLNRRMLVKDPSLISELVKIPSFISDSFLELLNPFARSNDHSGLLPASQLLQLTFSLGTESFCSRVSNRYHIIFISYTLFIRRFTVNVHGKPPLV